MAALRAIAAFLLLASAPVALAQGGLFCVLPAKIQTTSAAVVGGTIRHPVAAVMRPTARADFEGLLSLVFPQDTCPTPATLASALSKAYLATPKGWQGVTVGPSTAAVLVGSMRIANVSMTNLQGTILSKVGPQGIATPIVTANSGVVTTESSLEMARADPVPLAGRSISFSGAGCSLNVGGTSIVTIKCPQIKASSPFTTNKGSGDIQIRGVLTAIGDLAKAQLVPASLIPKPLQ